MLLQELRHALRSLRRSPALTAISIVTVGLGIAAGTSLFTVVKSVLLNPLPFPGSGRLVWANSLDDAHRERRVSLPDFDDWHKQSRALSSLAAFSIGNFLAGGGDAPERATGALVTEDFFDTLAVRPFLGRVFTPDEHHGGVLSTVILGHSLWQRAYGGDRSIVGRQVKILGLTSTVIGVMPRGFSFPERAELWLSARATGEGNVRTAPNYWVIGRLRPGATANSAAADLGAIASALKQQYPGPAQAAGATAVPLAEHVAGSARTPLLILFGAVGVLLLIVCVNVANLLLLRITTRGREFAMRLALGASDARLLRYLLLESMLLAAAGGALGCLVAVWSVDLIRVLLPATLPRSAEIHPDLGVVVFAAVTSAAAGLLFGALPSWRLRSLDIQDILRSGGRGHTGGPSLQLAQGLLIVSEVALSTVLLAGAGLLLGSFLRLRGVDPGFRPDGVLAVTISSPISREGLGRLVRDRDAMIGDIRALPGVQSAGVAKDLPLDPAQRRGRFRIADRTLEAAAEAGWEIVGPGTLETLRIPIVRGRGLTATDTPDAPAVAVVNEEMARRFWPGRDPIGERIWFEDFEPEHWLTVVGVAGSVRQNGLAEQAPPQAYVCYAQLLVPVQVASTSIVLRAAAPESLIPGVRQAVRQIDPGAAISFRMMRDLMAAATARQRFELQVLGAFAALAVLLAAIGLYGVMSYAVAGNRPAFAIRMALGASPADILRLVAARALALTAAGAAIGLVACAAMRGVLGKLLYGIGPSDPAVLAGAAAVMFAAALAACWFPARRAIRLDPLTALREE